MQEEKESVYIENSVVSYYTSRPNPDPIIRSRQEITRKWWPMAIKRYNVFISNVVLTEARRGDISAATKRLEEIENFTKLEITTDVAELFQFYSDELKFSRKNILDAAHLAIACLNDIDYLVTWNCTHLCNAEIIKKLMKINDQLGVHTSIICTPEQLTEVNNVRSDYL